MGYPTHLIAKAYSASGVSVAGAVNRDPSLFDDVILTNACLDVYATMCNSNLALTEHEKAKYGNPLLDERIADLIQSYCPTQTAFKGEGAPRMLLIGGLHDEAVPDWNT
mgnify:CR=1 FL=1